MTTVTSKLINVHRAAHPAPSSDAAMLKLTADETAAVLAWLEVHRAAHPANGAQKGTNE